MCDVAGERGLVPLPGAPGDSAGIARSGCRASTEDSGPRARGPGLCRAAAPRRSARRPRGGDPRCRPRQEDEEPGRARCAAHGGSATADAGCPRAPNARAGPPQLQPRTPAEGPALSPHPGPELAVPSPCGLPTPGLLRLPAARLGLARLIPAMTHAPAGRGRQGGACGKSLPGLRVTAAQPSKVFHLLCVCRPCRPACGLQSLWHTLWPSQALLGGLPPPPRTQSCQSARTPLNQEPGRALPQQRRTPRGGHVSNQTRHAISMPRPWSLRKPRAERRRPALPGCSQPALLVSGGISSPH